VTPEELRQIIEADVTVPFLVALEAIGVCETTGRKAHRRGELPFRVWVVGKAMRVPSCDLAVLLQPGQGSA
jgi:hypothetical protein